MKIVDKENSSIDEWFAACECEEKDLIGIKRIDTKDSIVFIQNEDYEEAVKYLKGNRVPQLEDSVDVLGDIDSFDIRDIDWVDGNDVIDTRYYIAHFHNRLPKYHFHEDENGVYDCGHYEGKMGYPSFLFKMWD